VLAAGIRGVASQIRKRANGSLPAGLSAGFVADEDDVDFDGCFSIGAIDFVYGKINLTTSFCNRF